MNDHYVYVLYREDGVTPFYIGMGHGDRWNQHERTCASKSHKNSIIRQMKARGIRVPKRKLAEGLSRGAAQVLEVSLIALLGREPLGPLVNIAVGGGGTIGFKHAPETLAKMSAGVNRYWAQPGARAKASIHSTGRRPTAAVRRVLSERSPLRNANNRFRADGLRWATDGVRNFWIHSRVPLPNGWRFGLTKARA